MAKEQVFTIEYYPDAFTRSPYVLGREETMAGALEAAAGYSRMYYGLCSPIMVCFGRKKIVTIPRRAT